jgi:hypothetical protein
MTGNASQEASGRASSDALLWISQGLLAVPCVLWWGFAHADDLLLLLGVVDPTQPILSVDYVWDRVLAVWCISVVLAVSVLVTLFRVRNRRIDGRSKASWVYFLLGMTTLAGVLVTARDVRKREVSLDMWVVYLASAVVFGQWFWARRRSSPEGRPVTEGDLRVPRR